MPRTSRAAVGGLVYHVLNRGNGRLPIFRKPGDFLAFLELMIDAKERAEVEIFGFCLMSKHGSTERSPKSGIWWCGHGGTGTWPPISPG